MLIINSRVQLRYEGRIVTARELNLPLYKFVNFKRAPTFEVVIIPPLRCRVCSYAHFRNKGIPSGAFVKGTLAFTYNFSETHSDLDIRNFEELTEDGFDKVEKEYEFRRDADLETIIGNCYCPSVAAEGGYKCLRSWAHFGR